MTFAGIPTVSTLTLPFHYTSGFVALKALVSLVEVMKLEIIARTWFHIFAFWAFVERHIEVPGLLLIGGLPVLLHVLIVGHNGYSGIPAYFSFQFELIGFELL